VIQAKTKATADYTNKDFTKLHLVDCFAPKEGTSSICCKKWTWNFP
jgi:hypothetical protein